jgi:hypothetical protein
MNIYASVSRIYNLPPFFDNNPSGLWSWRAWHTI